MVYLNLNSLYTYKYSITTPINKSFSFIVEAIAWVWENSAILSPLTEDKGMANRELLDEQRDETRLIIEELLDDGSDPDALYTIEHHLSAEKFEVLEKAAVEAFKLGYEVTDAEELEVEDGSVVMCCDVISEVALNADIIDAQVEQLVALAETCGVNYDGWGTYYEDPNAEDDEDGEFDDEELVDEDDDGKRH
ncbi:ribonuclease E inhibitor RraB [Yersinia aldovae]|nr:ribonuclease E inhibitor RraB [Yersinia aldovae]